MSSNRQRFRGFTLVELLMVMAITSLLVALLIPALAKGRELARITKCVANVHQHAIYFTQYVNDCRDRIPMPASPHLCADTAHPTLWMASALARVTPAGIYCASLEANGPQLWPTGFGWYYYMGYLKPHPAKTPLGTLDCPDAPVNKFDYWANAGARSLPMAREWDRSAHSLISAALVSKNLTAGTNPQGSSTDCVVAGEIGYTFRGWMRDANGKPAKKASEWMPGDAIEIDNYWTSGFTTNVDDGFLKSHQDGLSVGFFDGHAKFGGKRIAGREPFACYGMAMNNKSYYEAMGGGWGVAWSAWVANSAYNGNATNRLWNYYETGNQ